MCYGGSVANSKHDLQHWISFCTIQYSMIGLYVAACLSAMACYASILLAFPGRKQQAALLHMLALAPPALQGDNRDAQYLSTFPFIKLEG